MADLNKITSKVVDDDTDLEKVKVLHTRTVPKVENAVRELENTLPQYSRICDPIELDDQGGPQSLWIISRPCRTRARPLD